jgi:hypothetical protein
MSWVSSIWAADAKASQRNSHGKIMTALSNRANRANRRRAQRIKVTPRGEIFRGADSVKVLLQDISDEGFLLLCSWDLEAGELLEMKFQISPGLFIECKVEVRHSSDLGTGVRIVAMNELARRAFDRYLEEHYSHNHGRLS